MDLVFGSDVGFAERYRKEMVQDANGQISVSYKDAQGRLIATALAGEHPDNLEALPSYAGLIKRTLELSDKNEWIAEGPSMEVVHDFLVSSPGRYTVNYSFSPNSYEDGNCPRIDLCLDCVYDLTISITDECGEEQLINGGLVGTIGPLGSVDGLCNAGSLYEITDADDVYSDLEIGAYKITKRLSINQEALDAYVAFKLEEDECLKDLDDFVQEALAEVDYNGCGMDGCEFDCRYQLGHRRGLYGNYAQALADCMMTCAAEEVSYCEGFKSILEADMSPGGLFGAYEKTENGILVTDVYSIFHPNTQLYSNAGPADWRAPITAYADELGNPSLVNGYEPQMLSLEEFIENWQSSWAASLVEYHPDYCYVDWCDQVDASHQFDQALLAVESFEEAEALGYIDLDAWDDVDGFPFPSTNFPVAPFSIDPFYQTYIIPGVPFTSMISRMVSYFANSGLCSNVMYSMWDAAVIGTHCQLDPNTASCADIDACLANNVNLDDPCREDEAWILYRSLYLGQKANDLLVTLSAANCTQWGPFDRPRRTLRSSGEFSQSSTDLGNNVTDLENTQCEAACEGFVDSWLASLEGCMNMTNSQRTQIIQRFQGICENSCDVNNPLGSNEYNGESFQDVLIDVLGAGAIGPDCTADLISMPPSPGMIYTGGNAAIPYMDECACELILANDAEFEQLSANNELPEGVSSREDLFLQNHGVEVHNLQGKACDCNAAFAEGSSQPWQAGATWSVAAETFLENLNLPISADITCPRCEDCGTITGLVDQFIANDPAAANSDNALTLLESFMNRELGFTLSGQQYLDFYEQCEEAGDGGGSPLPPPGPANQSSGADGCLFGYGKGGSDVLNYLSFSDQLVNDYGLSSSANPNGLDWTAMAYDEGNGWMYAFSSCTNPVSFYKLDVRQQSQQATFEANIDPSINGIWAAAFDNVNQELYVVAYAGASNQHLYRMNLPYTSLSYVGYLSSNVSSTGCEVENDGIQGMTYDPANNTLYAVSATKFYHIDLSASSISLVYKGDLPPASFRGLTYDHVQGKLFGITHTGDVYELDPQDGGYVSQLPSMSNGQPASALAYVPSPDCVGGTGGCTPTTSIIFEENFDSYGFGVSSDPGRWSTQSLGTCSSTGPFYTDNNRFVCEDNICPQFMEWRTDPIDISGMTEVEIEVDLEHRTSNPGQVVMLYYSLDGGAEVLLNTYNDFIGVSNFSQSLTGLSNSDISLILRFDNGANFNIVYLDYVKISATGCEGDPPPDPTGLLLCDEPLFPRVALADNCAETLTQIATFHAEQAYEAYIAEVSENFARAYTEKCLDALELNEQFKLKYNDRQHHYTLYYYDQGGNLYQTVPPKGVDFLTNAEIADVHQDRLGTAGQEIYPNHSFKSNYVYNSLQQLVNQETPDAGSSDFYYDRLGRIVIGQNARQAGDGNYSYTLYDPIGRIVESGEMSNQDISNTDTRDESQLLTWLQGGTKLTYTHTNYDLETPNIYFDDDGRQENLRGRVAATDYIDLQNPSRNTSHYYSYDILGNVKRMGVGFPDIFILGDHVGDGFSPTMVMDYHYDLISGNVKRVRQIDHGEWDTIDLEYRYEYDADNRLIKAESGHNRGHWDTDAVYHYYAHGPLARTEIGEEQVQGMDYAYTLQGWMKGVNSSSLGRPERDMGKDGSTTHSYDYTPVNPHQFFARDAFGYTLGFYEGDYSSIRNIAIAERFEADFNNNYFSTSLFNGNINHMVTALSDLDANPLGNQISLYQYDQLNRITGMQVRRDNWGVENVNQWLAGNNSADLETAYTYDADGNLQSLLREGNFEAGPINMDDLSYEYEYELPNGPKRNRLLRVTDAMSDGNYSEDIDSQPPNNYEYDATGNLTADISEEIEEIIWTVDNKIQEIVRTAGSTRPNLEFRYDPAGNRICKIVKPGPNEVDWNYTYYIRDASGNVLSTLHQDFEPYPTQGPGYYIQTVILGEQHLYGSKRLGIQERDVLINSIIITANEVNGRLENKQYYDGYTPPGPGTFVGRPYYRGKKRYEFTNHLSNVIGLVSDRKHGRDRNLDGDVDFYEADVFAYSDFYPFGMKMIGRNGEREGYRYGFNGMEGDDEISGNGNSNTTFFRQYDPRLGRWFSIDPETDLLPDESPYAFSSNMPIIGNDENGDVCIPCIIVKMGIGGATDYFAQRAVAYFFDPQVQFDWKATHSKVNYFQVFRSAGENANPLKIPKYLKAPLAASGDVIVNYLNDPNYSTDKALFDFGVGFLSQLGADGITTFVGKYGKEPVRRGLAWLKLPLSKINKLTGSFGQQLRQRGKFGVTEKELLSNFRPGPEQGFTGVFNFRNGDFTIAPSGNTDISKSEFSENLIFNGGHFQMEEMLNPNQTLDLDKLGGFAIEFINNKNLAIRFRSGLNDWNGLAGDDGRTLTLENQEFVMKALKEAFPSFNIVKSNN